MKVKIAPSLMCSDFRHLEDEIRLFERKGIELLHLDIMDGHFVPNITMGPPVVKAISAMTRLTLDIHMMVTDAEAFIPVMASAGKPIISVHAETGQPLDRMIRAIRSHGARPAAAINPKTPLSVLSPVLAEVDLILLMCVQPGFAGQKLIPGTIEKIGELKRMLEGAGVSPMIEVDGNTTPDNIRRMAAQGAGVIVAGTSCLYRPGVPLERAL
jgi:ribulose-phosphate 3-epimerase